MLDIPELEKVLKDNSERWFWGEHYGGSKDHEPHKHWYIETTKWKEHALRSLVARYRRNNNTRAYSVSTLRSPLHHHMSYVMLKPETTDSDMYEITEEEVTQAIDYSRQFEQPVKNQKASESYMSRLIRECEYLTTAPIKINFRKMYDWLIDNKLYNFYTDTKMIQLFNTWAAVNEKINSPERYEKRYNQLFDRLFNEYEGFRGFQY